MEAFYFEDSLNAYFKTLPNIRNIYNLNYYDEMYGDLQEYFNEKKVKKALHVPYSIEYHCFNQTTLDMMDDDEERDASYLLPSILEKIPILYYSGDKDLICNVKTIFFFPLFSFLLSFKSI